MKQVLLKLLICSLLWFIRAHAVNYIDCGSQLTISDLSVEGCHGSHCIFLIGHNTTVTFLLNNGIRHIDATLINDVAFYIRGYKFATLVTPTDPCQNIRCPIEQYYSSQYSAEVFVIERFDPTYADLQWIIKTADGEQLLCFRVNVVLLRTNN